MRGARAMVTVLGSTGVIGAPVDIDLGGALPRGLLALLAIEAGRPVALDRVTWMLWGDRVPAAPKLALQQLVSRLRRGLAPADLDDALRLIAPGYVLDIDPDRVDLLRFRASMRRALDAARRGEPRAAVAAADEALAWWRGPAVADLVGLPVLAALGPFLDDERWRAEEFRATQLMANGDHGIAAAYLAAAVTHEPLRERLWVLQAGALECDGRPDEAVRVARTAMAAITSELGVMPGPELIDIEARLRDRRATPRPGPASIIATPVPAAPAHSSVLTEAVGRAIATAERAATAAAARCAFGEAAYQWRRLLDLLSGAPDDPTRIRALLGLGHAHNEGGSEVEARASFEECMSVAQRLGDPVAFAEAALGYCSDRVRLVPPPEQAACLRAAIARLPVHEHALGARLLARLAFETYWVEPVHEARALAAEALRRGLLSGDADARLNARHAVLWGLWEPQGTRELVDAGRIYLDDALECGDRSHELLARRWLVAALTELGEVEAGGVQAQLALDLADDLGQVVQQWVTRTVAAAHQLVAGDLDRAERLSTDALAIGATAEPATAMDYVSILLWTLRWMQGRLGEIAGLVEEVSNNPGADIARRLGAALTHAELGRIDQARTILDSLPDAVLDAMHVDSSWYVAMAAMAEAAHLTDHVDAARSVLRRLEPLADHIAITPVTSTGPVAHHLGICARVLGDCNGARRWLREAVRIADLYGAPAFGARSRVELAALLAGPSTPDAVIDPAHLADLAEAVDLAGRAADVAARCGMLGVAARAARILGG